MSGGSPDDRLDREGPAAPPRANGELVFEAPWESRMFGLTMALCDQGELAWDDFRARLIAEIGAWDRAHGENDPSYHYWARWLAALTEALGDANLLARAELDAREREVAARPAGHDHAHPHAH